MQVTSDKTPSLPEAQACRLCRAALGLLRAAFYYLWNFLIYGISSLETGWWGWTARAQKHSNSHSPRGWVEPWASLTVIPGFTHRETETRERNGICLRSHTSGRKCSRLAQRKAFQPLAQPLPNPGTLPGTV